MPLKEFRMSLKLLLISPEMKGTSNISRETFSDGRGTLNGVIGTWNVSGGKFNDTG